GIDVYYRRRIIWDCKIPALIGTQEKRQMAWGEETAGTCAASLQALNILFITLEFRTGTFSGNGVYATAQVRALVADGHQVFVICAAPAHAKAPPDDFGVAKIYEVPVSSWHRLDAGAPWREFAAGAAEEGPGGMVRAFAPDVILAVDWSALQAVRNLLPYCNGAPYVYLNYRVFTRTATGHDLELIRGLESAAMEEALLTVALSRSDAEYLATNVRGPVGAGAAGAVPVMAPPTATQQPPIHPVTAPTTIPTSTSLNHQESERTPQNGTISQPQPQPQPQLAPGSAASAQQSREPKGGTDPTSAPLGLTVAAASAPAPGGPGVWKKNPKVLLPALREDMRKLEPPAELQHLETLLQRGGLQSGASREGRDGSCTVAAEAWAHARPYLSCVVRLSPEKEPERFITLVEAMSAAGLLERHRLTPLLLGVANDEYAQGLKARLRAAAPSSVILESFIGPAELAAVYRQTRLNFHPSTYDAYGMTIVEAASQGAPSVVHDGGSVGATDLMRGLEGEVILLDLEAPVEKLAAAISRVLEDSQALAATSVRALWRARSWDEAANAAELMRLVREEMMQCPVE
ncbi:hypothetical protein Vretifemale_20301, partial [Volvox reticuliferus]